MKSAAMNTPAMPPTVPATTGVVESEEVAEDGLAGADGETVGEDVTKGWTETSAIVVE